MPTLTNADPLANLADIINPSKPNIWPPAPIYWVILIVVLLLFFLFFLYLKKHKKNREYDNAMRQQLQKMIHQETNFIQLNQFLKSIALHYFPRHQVASLHGKSWFDFLTMYSQKNLFGGQQLFLQRLYQNTHRCCTAEDFNDAKTWVAGLKKEIKKRTKNV